MEDAESYHRRLRAARLRSKGVVQEIVAHEGKLLIAFPQHYGLFTLPPDREDLMARILESRDKQQEIGFTFNGELMIVDIG